MFLVLTKPQKCETKYKIRNLKNAYKTSRSNNKKTGASPTYSPYFEDFEVLRARDVINTPFAREFGVLNQDDVSDDGGKDNLILLRIYNFKVFLTDI